ncbi:MULTISPECIES: VOC family protein [Parachlamydia]|uniref:VOC family protein n=1 Tax=Parachlamydia TaxID=83551 RepID=UPI0001C173A3|nr:VOC family protein [Parachlamydia acanthamoebae]EFB41345.1 hypothetical protein pah_c045o048 [Parachlamydia acanthamoebae str. Hall's coccus]
MKIQAIKLCWVVVSNLEQAVKFYQECLGLQLIEWDKQFGWAEFEGYEGGGRLGVAQVSEYTQIPAGSNAVVALNVEDIENAKEACVQKGVTCVGDVIEVPGQVKLLACRDQDGNWFQLAQVLS